MDSYKLFGYEDPRRAHAADRKDRLARRVALKSAKGSMASPKAKKK
jgi:hypothetical protein